MQIKLSKLFDALSSTKVGIGGSAESSEIVFCDTNKASFSGLVF